MYMTLTRPIGRERVEDLLPTLPASLGPLDVRHFREKVNEQKYIVKSREDVRVLKLAMTAFTSLQHVQLLRYCETPGLSLR
jgi:hypothetical protein